MYLVPGVAYWRSTRSRSGSRPGRSLGAVEVWISSPMVKPAALVWSKARGLAV